MRCAVAALYTIPAFFALLFAGWSGAFDGHGRSATWLFVLDVVAMISLAVVALIDASVLEAGAERRRLVALALPSLVFGLGAAFVLFVATHVQLQ